MDEQAILEQVTSDQTFLIYGAVFILLSQFFVQVLRIVIENKREKVKTEQQAECLAHAAVQRIQPQVDHLLGMHDVRDSDGRLVWWSDPGIKKALNANTTQLSELTSVFQTMLEVAKDNTKAMQELVKQNSPPNS